MAGLFSRSVNKNLSIEQLLVDEYPYFEMFTDEIKVIQATYQNQKNRHQFCDYDDLLIFLYRLLQEAPVACEQISAKYRYIMVDEYQDTNLL